MAATTTSTARETLNRIIEMQPASEAAARAHHELGATHLASGNLEHATASFRRVSEAWPAWHAKAGHAIGLLYEKQLGDIDAAAREYRKVIRMHPETFPAAESYARLGDLHASVADTVSAENMRTCAVRTYERVVTRSSDAAERDQALGQLVAVSRELERWDVAIEALIRRRRQAVQERDHAKSIELDHSLGLIYMERQQHGNALIRFRTCLEQARRRADLPAILRLSEHVATCQRLAEDGPGVRRTYRSLIQFVSRSPQRLSAVQADPGSAAVLARAYLAVDRPDDARRVRARLARQRSVEAVSAVTALDAEFAAAAG